MTEELRRDLEEGMRKFLFEKIDAALFGIKAELRKVLQKHGIQNADVDVSQVEGTCDIDAILSFDGRIISCRLSSESATFEELLYSKKV